MMFKTKKILVIGASIAGPTVCFWLKKFGFSPTLIEKSDTLRKGGYAVDIRGIAVDVVKKMGRYEQINTMRTQIKSGRYVDAQGHTLFEEQGEKNGYRQGEEVEIVRGDLVEILMQTIQDIPCYFNQSIDRLEQNDGNVKVLFKDGRSENYDLVIAADGLHSSTRGMAFAKDEYRLASLGAYICIFKAPNYLNLEHSETIFETQQKLVCINSDKHPKTAFASFMFRSDHTLNDSRDEKEQKDFLRKTFYNLGWETNNLLELMEESDSFYFDSITQVKMSTWTKGRVALVGDAGYCPSPLSGQGTSLALVGAYLLAGELKTAGGNYSMAFARYNALLRPFVDVNQGFGAWASEFFLMPHEVSKEMAESRAASTLEKIKTASHAINLPEYL